MAGKLEPLVRRSRGDNRRTAVLAVRIRPNSLAEIDALATRRGWTRADAVRALLRAGLEVESRR